MDEATLVQIALFYGVLLTSLVVHEASHALFAYWGGDNTAYLGGQVSLNPVPHIRREPFGTVILPLGMLILSGGAWCMGYAHAPIDARWAERNPKKAALVSAAGPLSNMLLVAIAFFTIKGMIWGGLADPFPVSGSDGAYAQPIDSDDRATFAILRIASVFLVLNIVLAVLNLIPFPPLDGAGIVEGLKPNPMRRFYNSIRTQPILLLVGMIVLFKTLPSLFWPVVDVVVGWI